MAQSTGVFWTIHLDAPLATKSDRVGVKAAYLARAGQHDLPVLPGFVVPVQCAADSAVYRNTGELRAAWAKLSHNGQRPVVVRSSPIEKDGARPPGAGRFGPVPGVREWPGFLGAVKSVEASADGPGTMAVLVQPRLDAVTSGVMLGAGPLDGRTDRVIVSAVEGGPQALAGGEVGGTRYVLTHWGRAVDAAGDRIHDEHSLLSRHQLRSLARLASRASHVFGGPQDIEFAFDRDERLWVLQILP
ncbi:PEP/pyruvate-binding domain-containing protein [Spirillospora sp. NBC_01491]|uniref:PEP/pyruvate-binding domain-containing protein n=1 Tax=Spirillospora sp. NBC_01491 TaxID=2976007 RepID=UPI002E365932|nr:PEP/pyruvate-binding domain-containing protein [Spirillospora sp. NBC_01491]